MAQGGLPMDRKDETSFDPRTWGGDVPARSHQDATSFDPRGWAPMGQTASPPRSRRRLLVPMLSGVAIVTALGVVALTMRPTAPTGPAPIASGSADAPAVPPSRRTLMLDAPSGIEPALVAAGVDRESAGDAARRALAAIGPARGEIRLELDLREQGARATLLAMQATRADGAGLALTRRVDGRLAAQPLSANLSTRVRVVRGEMDDDSFYTSAVTAGVTDSLISDFANAFSFDFNFATDVKPGDIFEAAFAQGYNPSGEPVGVPRLLYVSLSTAAKSRALYRFHPPGGEAGWYDGNGRSTVRALMMTPVDGARISSKFGPRFHPVLHFMKLHRGTDFAAPTGTPIFASGDATVSFAAMKGANGNLTILRHDNGWLTYYLHQSMFMPGIAPGARVRQGQKIGEIGTTGRSTGPHLHYEVHIDGQPVDPMTIPTGGTSKPLAGGALAAFAQERDRIDRARAEVD
jgi:murein DD-endopeptidase MepM/ murein hydrolase activator NlpD